MPTCTCTCGHACVSASGSSPSSSLCSRTLCARSPSCTHSSPHSPATPFQSQPPPSCPTLPLPGIAHLTSVPAPQTPFTSACVPRTSPLPACRTPPGTLPLPSAPRPRASTQHEVRPRCSRCHRLPERASAQTACLQEGRAQARTLPGWAPGFWPAQPVVVKLFQRGEWCSTRCIQDQHGSWHQTCVPFMRPGRLTVTMTAYACMCVCVLVRVCAWKV